MKVYQDLAFRGDPQALEHLIAEIERRLTDGWSRSHGREAEIRRYALGRMYCFACTRLDIRPAGELWIAERTRQELYVANIVPSESSSLTYDQYNLIIQEFYNRFAQPAAEASHISAELGGSDIKIESFLSSRAVELLRNFSVLANRSMLHPLDRERWNKFLTAAHREHARLDSSTLQRWLIEEERWPEGKAIDLAIEYEQGRSLLETYESLIA